MVAIFYSVIIAPSQDNYTIHMMKSSSRNVHRYLITSAEFSDDATSNVNEVE